MRRFFFQAVHLDTVAAQAISVDASRRDEAHDRTMADLDAAIAALPAALKEPLIMTVFAGLSQKETALALGVSAKAVETRLYRARQILGGALDLAKGADESA